ncbi:MAG TPA: right-handed parallel beta-helix repeat-containing protein [Verrucomicrobiota bacterium]|nr:right-handed parallel beta-helix repeat-containing protein [Verrucomicrobiota bacterium]HNU49862.1 right-handed parallel beta-helix repeat-containing protein [Verrucomicrobiota bacterium]
MRCCRLFKIPVRLESQFRLGSRPWLALWLGLGLLVLGNLPAGVARTLVLNVATNGNDDWSGGLAVPTPSRDDGPLATLGAALKTVQALRWSQPDQFDGVTILLRGGTYEVEEPIVLLPDHAGSDAQRPLLITAYPDEKPILSGGRRITGWKRLEDRPGLWQAEIADVRDGRWYFRQLFVNGQRKMRARTPNDAFFRIQGESPTGKPVQLKYKEGDLRKAWAEDGDVEAVALLAWADLRMQIRALDESNHVATLSGEPRPSNREANAQYYIENAIDALDQPGEWYLNRKTGVLLYWPEPGEDLMRAEVVAPRLEELVRFQGSPAWGGAVRHVILRDLTFAHTDWALGPTGYADTQAAVEIRGDLRAEYATDCVIEDCTFTHLGGYGLDLGRGCQQWQVLGNEMFDLGAGAIRIGETEVPKDPTARNHGHTVTDNHLYRLGRVYASGVGVFVLQSGDNRIAHNHIHDLYYTAISLGWNWGYQETPCCSNVVEFNHLHDIGKSLLSDMGAIYTLGIQRGTVLRNNLIHDVNAFTYGGWGLYTDEGSSYILLENNLVYRCKSAGFHQHYGRENIVRNNIFALNREHQLMRSREEDHRSFVFERNIVYFDSGDLLGSTWTNNQFRMDANLYFDARPEARPETLRFAGASLDEWRKRGHDVNSIVADPLFYNVRAYNFRLTPSSPAFRTGFNPIDLTRVGVRRKTARR